MLSLSDLLVLEPKERVALLKESFRINHITYLVEPPTDVFNKNVTIYANLTSSHILHLPGIEAGINTTRVTDHIVAPGLGGQGKDLFLSPVFIADIDVFTSFNLGADAYINYSESIKSAYKSEDNVYKSVINSLGVIDTNTPLYLLERDGTYSVVNGDSLDAKLQSAYGRLSKERGIPVVD